MRFIQGLFAGAAIVAAALAVEITNWPATVEAGQTYKITYSPAGNTPTTFILRQGDPNDLKTLGTLTETAVNGEFEWTVDSSLPNGDNYALQVKQGSEENYTGLISLSGGSASASSSASSASSTASSSASSSSASSSETATITSTVTSTSVSGVPSPSSGTNSTINSATLSTGTSAPTGSTTGSGPPQSTGAAAMLASSPLALIFGAVAAMAYLN